eukprot:GHVU01190320.1.p1 GENE.GHVU01190320.1~~GHVU01190320.1.p1  ORF type:complete len:463 (+),score=92.28 GHVU01190320.1:129-1517(+)
MNTTMHTNADGGSGGSPSERYPAGVVLDTAAFIRLKDLSQFGGTCYVTPGVVREIRDAKARQNLQLQAELPQIIEPEEEDEKAVAAFAKQTGDFSSLSPTDIEVIAATRMLHRLSGPSAVRSLRARPLPTVEEVARVAHRWGPRPVAAASASTAAVASVTTTTEPHDLGEQSSGCCSDDGGDNPDACSGDSVSKDKATAEGHGSGRCCPPSDDRDDGVVGGAVVGPALLADGSAPPGYPTGLAGRRRSSRCSSCYFSASDADSEWGGFLDCADEDGNLYAELLQETQSAPGCAAAPSWTRSDGCCSLAEREAYGTEGAATKLRRAEGCEDGEGGPRRHEETGDEEGKQEQGEDGEDEQQKEEEDEEEEEEDEYVEDGEECGSVLGEMTSSGVGHDIVQEVLVEGGGWGDDGEGEWIDSDNFYRRRSRRLPHRADTTQRPLLPLLPPVHSRLSTSFLLKVRRE